LLDAALTLNPALDQVPYYHIERGQAFYALHPNEQSDDSRAYLAFVYRLQGDNLDADQELLAVWHVHPTTPWVVDELSITLERLAEYVQQPNSPPVQRADSDIAAMSWLQILAQIDASNVYGQYLLGRFQYYLHSYDACIARMTRVIQLSRNTDIQSSAYTYMGLSVAGQGDIPRERRLLFEAVKLDPSYRNNTAREELSGLH
jgi:tetratricopeptide (TPR) repeat protein